MQQVSGILVGVMIICQHIARKLLSSSHAPRGGRESHPAADRRLFTRTRSDFSVDNSPSTQQVVKSSGAGVRERGVLLHADRGK